MALDFTVGNADMQGLLEWVAEPPPPQGRDTHAIIFALVQKTPVLTPTPLHHGLMFFHRGASPTAGTFRNMHGLSGSGVLVNQESNVPSAPPFWVGVEVRFRILPGPPPQTHVFGALRFGRGPFPPTAVRTVELNELSMPAAGNPVLQLPAPPESWELQGLRTTTVLPFR